MLATHVSYLDNYARLVAKYSVHNALEKLQIINIASKKAFFKTSTTENTNHCVSGEDFEKNIDFIKHNLIELFCEFEEKGTFTKLQEVVEENESLESKSIQWDDAENEIKLEIMEQLLSTTETELHGDVSKKEMASHILDTEYLETMKQRLEIEKRYNESWEKSNFDQVNYSIEREEKRERFEYERYKLLLEKEEEAAKSLIDFYQSKIHNLDDMLEYWREEYDHEMENIAHEIHLTEDWIKGLEKQIAHQEENYKQFQDHVHMLYQNRQQICSARQIQRWWRAILASRPKPSSRRSRKRKGKQGLPQKKTIQPSRQTLNIRTQALANVPLDGPSKSSDSWTKSRTLKTKNSN